MILDIRIIMTRQLGFCVWERFCNYFNQLNEEYLKARNIDLYSHLRFWERSFIEFYDNEIENINDDISSGMKSFLRIYFEERKEMSIE